MKSNEDEIQNKLSETKHTLKYCLNYIIKHEDIDEQDNEFIREELLTFFEELYKYKYSDREKK